MKGQYFSFDAIVATIIMVLAMTSLIAYWYGVQSVIDSRTTPLYSESLRVAESLLSPGVPANWPEYADRGDWGSIKQIGLSMDYNPNEINKTKLDALVKYSEPGTAISEYARIGALFRTAGYNENFYILLQQADNTTVNSVPIQVGSTYPANATEVEVADRGVVMDGHPYKMRVFLWRK
ncbi:Uncharacterised protein [uncultured archaeon]|nr:Uncharacterised protein [uncultured archaeon]